LDFAKRDRCKLVLLRLSLAGNQEKHLCPSMGSNRGSVAMDSVMKSNTVTRFKIISGLRNSFQNHRQVPVCRNKQFEEVNGRIFTIRERFHRSKPIFNLFFSP
jgi:hypothetical protein